MNLFGLSITRQKAAPNTDLITHFPSEIGSYSSRGWLSVIKEAFTGAWQRNIEYRPENVLTFATVYACITLIASDIGKLMLILTQSDADNIWTPTQSAAFSPVLRKPNHYQNRIQFLEQWVISKLARGNTYILMERDQRNVVTALYPLDPSRVQVLVADDGSVFYQLQADYLSGVKTEAVPVPASEIIHDRMCPLYHPLVGISPISACGLAAIQGLNIQEQSSLAFANQLNPSGVLTAPHHIPKDTADRLQAHWENNYVGPQNMGKIAVLGDGLKFDKMTLTAVDAQLIDQLKWTGETVCSCFHVPPYMVGVGPPPNYNNIEALNQQYYSQCLQALIEAIELGLEEGLSVTTGTPETSYGIELDLEGLLRMDSATKMTTSTAGVKGGVLTVNEARRSHNKKPIEGGDTVYLQQQDYSVEALNRRDQASPAPASGGATTPPQTPTEVQPRARDFEWRKRRVERKSVKAFYGDDAAAA